MVVCYYYVNVIFLIGGIITKSYIWLVTNYVCPKKSKKLLPHSTTLSYCTSKKHQKRLVTKSYFVVLLDSSILALLQTVNSTRYLWSNVVCTMYYVLLHKHSTWCGKNYVLFTVCNRAIILSWFRKCKVFKNLATIKVARAILIKFYWSNRILLIHSD